MTDKAIKCPYTDHAIEEVFGEEVSLFMHCHMRGYDKTGTGEQLWSDYYDKYGAPVDLLDSWLEGYHVIEKLLVKFMELCDNQIMDFPAVAGVAGGVHLYESLHSENPWQWTGWVPLQRKWLAEGKFFSNRYFISIRGNEIQNNLWNYHPHELEDADEASGFQPVDTYRGGFFFKDNPFGRYLHVMTIKEHSTVSYLQKPRRYNYIVHPLAYRKALNEIPDNGVDAMQWCIININNEKNFSEYTSPYGKCQALEIFNDFTFSASYQPESSDTCYNGTLIPGKYIYWFDTYPLEYAEFMLDSALTRGVYLHTLTSNDVFFKKVEEFDPDNDVQSEEKLVKYLCDPKGGLRVSNLRATKGARREIVSTRTERKLKYLDDTTKEKIVEATEFLGSRPYGFDTVFAFTTLIDTERRIHQAIYERDFPGTGIDDAEALVMQYLIDGNFYSTLGLNRMFEYSLKHQMVPYLIKNQESCKKMCTIIEAEKDMVLEFTFAKLKNKPSCQRLIWRYTIMVETNKGTLETTHGYFKLSNQGKTILDLTSSYDLMKVKWIYFVAIDPVNPMKRAWFNAIRGPAFGYTEIVKQTEGLNWADSGYIDRAVRVAGAWLSQWRGKEYERIQIPELKHRVFGTTSSKKHRNKLIQGKELAPVSYESKDLDFRFPKCANDNEDICVYFLQACPLQQDTGIPKKTSQSSTHRPPRIQQSVHGLYLMHPDYETRLKLSNSWDKNTVKDNIVYFYDISAATGQPYILPVAHALID